VFNETAQAGIALFRVLIWLVYEPMEAGIIWATYRKLIRAHSTVVGIHIELKMLLTMIFIFGLESRITFTSVVKAARTSAVFWPSDRYHSCPSAL
jgi:hypothetical protein